MNVRHSNGLVLGLLVTLLTMGLVAVSASPAPSSATVAVAVAAATAVAPTSEPTPLTPATPETVTPTTPAATAPQPLPTVPSVKTTTSPTRPEATTSARATDTPSPTPAPPTVPTAGADTSLVIGHSTQGRELVAHRFGEGRIKVVLVGDIHGEMEGNTHLLAQQLIAHFEDNPDEVPLYVSLWIIPTMNPDGLATGHRWNANDVDLNRNADTDLDGCAGNDWATDTYGIEGLHPGAGGAYPFSEPESQAMLDFLSDAWVAVFYHSAADAIFLDTCQRHAPTARLAELLGEGSGYPIPEEGWAGYPITGDWGDYLAGEGVAAITVELTDHESPEFERNLAGLRSLLSDLPSVLSAEASEVGADYVWLGDGNLGLWKYAENRFIHPLALEVLDNTGYLLDGGRVLALELEQPSAPQVLLAPGDDVGDTRVLEPLDLAVDGESILVLDRAGDVYAYAPTTGAWTLERYDRPANDLYDHYYVALTASGRERYLLETTHEQVWSYTAGEKGQPQTKLPQGRDVDVSAFEDDVYVLTRNLNSPIGHLTLYRDGRQRSAFEPNVGLMHPRQVVATQNTVYVLDRAGRRLLALDPEDGALQNLTQFTDRRSVSAMWAAPSGERIILAGTDAIYFVDEPQQNALIDGGPALDGPQPHDTALLASLRGLQMPIEGATVTRRDFQMPGAPRHYRLGVHEGMDFYGHTVGVTINTRTPIRAVADGVVIRALVDYEPLTAAGAEAMYARSLEAGYTPPDVLDVYRGRQVWIDHGGGLVSRYAHTSSIAPGISEGVTVTQGQVIALVGNSGTPGSVDSDTYDAHLHMELWLGEAQPDDPGNSHYAGQFLRPIEAREWLERILR